MASNNITPLPLRPSGRKSGQKKTTPQRGMGVAQLELLLQQDLWAPHFSNRPVHNFPDRRLPPVPFFPGHAVGAASGSFIPKQPNNHRTGRFGTGAQVVATDRSYCCSVCFKKRLANYGDQQAPPVAGGYGHVGPTYNNPNLNVENTGEQEEVLAIASVGKNRIGMLTQYYEFFPAKMIDRDRDRDQTNKLGGSDHDALPQVSGNAASDHRSNTTIDLSLRL